MRAVLRFVPAAAALCAAALALGGAAAAQAAAPRPLRPTRILAIPPLPAHLPATQVLHAHLTSVGARATVRVRVNAQGTGALTVTEGGRVLLRAPHVAAVGLLFFSTHRPVLMAESDSFDCGSGGCQYTGYTYVGRAHRMEAIAGGAGYLPTRYALRGRRFVPSGPAQVRFAGFLRLTPKGLVLLNPTEDGLAHVMYQGYGYVPGASGPGSWTALGAATFGPDRPLPHSYPGSTTAAGVAAQFVRAVCMGLPAEAASAGTGAAAGRALYAAASRVLQPCGLPVIVDEGVATPAGGQTVATMRVFAQWGPENALHAYRVRVTSAKASLRVRGLTARRLPVRYATPAQVLMVAARSHVVRAFVAAHPGARLEEPTPSGPQVWSLSFDLTSGRVVSGTMDAVTGAIRLPAPA